jgi:DeoR family transcriptional regulator, glycerol-3-phosphate regulon repressor
MALRRAEHRVVLSDSSKFEKSALVQVCDYNDFDRLITNEMPGEALKAALDKGGIIIDVVTV